MTTTERTTFTPQGERDLLMTRTFNAPREAVFKAWTDCEVLKQWWGPRQWPTEYCTLDLRPGGVWHYCMREVGTGNESWGKAVYGEISAPERLAYTDYFSDKDGGELSPPTVSSFKFEERDGKTIVTAITTFTSKAHLDEVLGMGMEDGMNDSLERLDEYLATL